MSVEIREELPGDLSAIHAVNAQAFETGEEARLVDALREAGAIELSLVAVDGDRVVGHICFSPATIDRGMVRANLVCLAPMAVEPGRQRQGVGSALVREGLERLRERRHVAIVLVGHPDYYPRFGFVRGSSFGLRCSFECPDEAFMAMELEPGALAGLQGGVVRFRPEFGVG